MSERLRIFISSPGDVAAEREKARQVISRLQDWYGADVVELTALFWEDLPLQATASFQQGVDTILSRESGIDIAIFILWSRMGTPLGPNIQHVDGTPYRSGTEREFDLMRQANAETCGERPTMHVYVRKDETAFAGRLSGRPPLELREIVDQRLAVDNFVREQFHDQAGHNRGAYFVYPDSVSFARLLHTHLKELIDTRLQSTARSEALWLEAPYRGLEYFDVDHARIFFGRGSETAEVVQRLRDRAKSPDDGVSFVCIVGASGAGKSSLARAGVGGTLLHDQYDIEVAQWRVAAFLPRDAEAKLGTGLIAALKRALPELASVFEETDFSNPEIESLRTVFKTTVKPCLKRLGTAGQPANLLLIVDQLEEFYLDRRIGAPDRAKFWSFLDELARSGVASVLATLRSDHYALAQNDDGFLALKGATGMYDLVPPRAIESTIRRPAAMRGCEFESNAVGLSLDEVILQDALKHPDALPSLQDLLRALYEQRNASNRLTFAAYEALGGIDGAVGRRAEDIFKELPKAQQDALPNLLRRLVRISLDTEIISARPVLPSEIDADSPEWQLVEALASPMARLLVRHEGDIRVAHEALLHRWPSAADFVERDRERHKAHSRLMAELKHWEYGNQADDLLLPAGRKLLDAELLIKDWGEQVVGQAATAYVRLSRNKVRHQRSERHRLILFLSLTTLFSVGGGYWLFGVLTGAKELAEARARTEQSKKFAIAGIAALRDGLLDDAWILAAASAAIEPPMSTLPIKEEDVWGEINKHPRPPVVLRGHAQRLTTVAFSPDGKRVLTTAEDATARVWDTLTGRNLLVLQGHQFDVTKAAFSPDGNRILTGSTDKTARLWDASSGQLLREWQHEGYITGVSYSQTGEKLLTSAIYGSATVRRVDNGELIRELRWEGAPSLVSAISHNGSRAVTGSDDGNAQLWDTDSGKKITDLPGHEGPIRLAAFRTDDRRVVTVTVNGAIHVWDENGRRIAAWPERGRAITTNGSHVLVDTFDPSENDWSASVINAESGEKISLLLGHAETLNSAVFSGDGKTLVTGSDDKTARIWDVTSGRLLRTLGGHDKPITAVAISSDGRQVLTGSDDGTTRLWDNFSAPDGSAVLELVGRANAAVFSPDSRLVLAASDDKKTRVWNPTGQITVLDGHQAPVTTAAFDHAGKRIVTTSEDGSAHLWNLAGQRIAMLRGHADTVNSALFSPDDKLIVTASDDGTARLWDANTGTAKAVLRGHQGVVRRAIFDPAGARVATISADETARLWGLDGKQLARLSGHEDALLTLAFSPNGALLSTGARDDTIRLWNTQNGNPIRVLLGHKGGVAALAFSPDGQWLASGSADHRTRIWDVGTGIQRAILTGHDGAINALAFSPDGKSLVTASDDKTVREWYSANGQLKAVLKGHAHWVSSAAYSPDGRRIATASQDGTVRLWASARDATDRADFAMAMSPEYPDGSLAAATGLSGETMFARRVPSTSGATECDKLAAHPFDPQRVAPGVQWARLDKKAVDSCRNAVDNAPDNPRLRFQLGRALDKFGDPQGQAAIEKAARQGYLCAEGAFGQNLIKVGNEKSDTKLVAEGIEWLRRSAKKGDPASQNNLADAIKQGVHVSHDLNEAKRWAMLAAIQCVPEAHMTLAEIAEESDPSAGKSDYDIAFFHHALAARCAHALGDHGKARLEGERRAALARLLPADRVVALWRAALRWSPGAAIDLPPP